LAAIDESIARTLAKIDTLGLLDRTDIIIGSDHGFARNAEGVNVTEALITAGLKEGPKSADLIVANQGSSLLFYLPTRNTGPTEKLVRFLQTQRWVDVIFTRGGRDGQGSVPGTFSLDLIQASHVSRSADVVVTLPWTSQPNSYGVPGSHAVHNAVTGPREGDASGHGGLNPYEVHNTFLAWGSSFKQRTRVDAPVSLADVTPTVLTLLGLEGRGPRAGRGRVLRELLKDGPAVGSVRTTRRVVRAAAGSYRASVNVSTVAGYDYIDSGSREK
jgi:arylsulfatase A-like enzyme